MRTAEEIAALRRNAAHKAVFESVNGAGSWEIANDLRPVRAVPDATTQKLNELSLEERRFWDAKPKDSIAAQRERLRLRYLLGEGKITVEQAHAQLSAFNVRKKEGRAQRSTLVRTSQLKRGTMTVEQYAALVGTSVQVAAARQQDIKLHDWIANDKQRLLELSRNLKRIAVNRMGGKCCVCGYNKCQTALEFHHVNPYKKRWNIAELLSLGLWNAVKSELRQCVMLCANCHREVEKGITEVPAQLQAAALLASHTIDPAHGRGDTGYLYKLEEEGEKEADDVSADEIAELQASWSVQ